MAAVPVQAQYLDSKLQELQVQFSPQHRYESRRQQFKSLADDIRSRHKALEEAHFRRLSGWETAGYHAYRLIGQGQKAQQFAHSRVTQNIVRLAEEAESTYQTVDRELSVSTQLTQSNFGMLNEALAVWGQFQARVDDLEATVTKQREEVQTIAEKTDPANGFVYDRLAKAQQILLEATRRRDTEITKRDTAYRIVCEAEAAQAAYQETAGDLSALRNDAFEGYRGSLEVRTAMGAASIGEFNLTGILTMLDGIFSRLAKMAPTQQEEIRLRQRRKPSPFNGSSGLSADAQRRHVEEIRGRLSAPVV